MTERVNISKKELDDLREHVETLALEKSHVELVMRMMNRISATTGLDNTIQSLLTQTMDVVGGTNLILYYKLNSKIHYADVYGEKRDYDYVDDYLVLEAFETRMPAEHVHETGVLGVATPGITKGYTWAYPMAAGTEVVAVLKLENLDISTHDILVRLPTFFNYAALVIANEITSASTLRQAYDQLSAANAELTKAKAELENRVAERTIDLREAMDNLQNQLAERTRAEESLREKTEELDRVFSLSLDLLCVADTETRFIRLNPAWEETLGYRIDELEGRSYMDFVHPDDIETTKQATADLAAGRQVIDFVNRYRRSDGSYRWIEWRSRSYQKNLIYAAARDITKRKESEERLVLLDFALNSVREAVVLVDETARIRYCNKEIQRTLGYSREELLSMTVFDIAADFTEENWPEHWKNVVSKRSLRFESRSVTKHGGGFPIEVSANYFEYMGKAYNMALVRDITERKNAELERAAMLRFFENMDKVNRAIQAADNVEQMLNDVLEMLLSIFDCDRAFILYPCDPEAPSWWPVMERTRPEYPGAFTWGGKYPTDPDIATSFRTLRDTDGPVTTGVGSDFPLSSELRKRHRVQSTIGMAIYPKVDKPYMLGLHQCSYPRVWKESEKTLFQEIGRRISDGLSTLLSYREARQSQQTMQTLVQSIPDTIVRFDSDLRFTYVSPSVVRTFGIPSHEFLGKRIHEVEPRIDEATSYYLEELIEQAFKEGLPTTTDVQWPTQEGIRLYNVVNVPEKDENGVVMSVLGIARDITERKRAEEERTATLQFFENMDKVNRAIQAADNVEQMLFDVLETLLSILDCDRAFILYPCDPKAPTWRAVMERTRPEYPGAFVRGGEYPVSEIGRTNYEKLLAADGPLTFGPGFDLPLARYVTEDHQVQSMIGMAIYPKVDKPYMFGAQQCSYPRVWTESDKTLFQEIGRRISDSLSNLLSYRNLQESEENYRTLNKTLQKANRTLTMLSNVNEALIHSTNESALLDEVCRIAVDTGEYLMAWIGYADNDEAKTVRPVVSAGHVAGFFDNVQISWADTELGQGLSGTAIRTGEPSYITDATTDARIAPWRNEVLERGYRSGIAVPLSDQGGVFGALSIYSSELAIFEQEEIELLEELAGDLSYGIQALRTSEERRKAEQVLRHSEEKYRGLYESMMDGYVQYDMDGTIVESNDRYREMLGYSADELRKMSYWDLTPAKWHNCERKILEEEVMQRGYSDIYEKEYMKRDGTTFPAELRKYLLRDNEGKPIGTWSIIRDISDRKHTEQEKRQFYRDTILSVTDGRLEITDRDKADTYISRSDVRRSFTSPEELSSVRNSIIHYCESQELSSEQIDFFLSGVGEALTNALKHAGGGEVFCGVDREQLSIGTMDTGPGIATFALPSAMLRRGYSTKMSLGLGYSIMLNVTDHVLLSTGPEGTVVILFKRLQEEEKEPLAVLVDTWDTIRT